MKLKEIINELQLEVLTDVSLEERTVEGAYVSDLLSDVMGNADEGQVWLTLQTHTNIVAVASLKEMSAILLVNNNKPTEETLKAANEKEVPILSSSLDTFTLAGKLFKLINL